MIHFSGSKSLPCGPIKKEALQVSHLINCLTRYVGYHFQSRNVGLHLAGISCLLVSWGFLLTFLLTFLSHALEHTYGAQCFFSASSYCRRSGRFIPPTSALLSSFLKTMSVKESMLFATSCLLFTKVIVSIETAVYRIKMLHIINGQKNQSDHPVTLWHELRISLVRLYILTARCMSA